MIRKIRALTVLLLVFSFAPLHAQIDQEGFDDYTFKIAIYGPDDEIFIWWGHAALIVENTNWYYPRVYDWGIFSYPSDNFLKDFIHDRVRYMVSWGTLNINTRIDEDRDITIYTLALDRTAKEIMYDYAESRVRAEDRYYDYHEFLDNCSTGVRDILDLGLRGQLKDTLENVPGRISMRHHVRRFTWFRPFSDWFLDFLMGRDLDEKRSPWDEMFLPAEIARNIVDFKYIDEHGTERSLVSSVQLLNTSKTRPPILQEPLITWPYYLAAGLAVMWLLFFIETRREKFPRLFRILWGSIQSLMGLILGACGTVLFIGLYLLNYDYIQQNLNILFVNPLLLIIVPLGILFALNKSSLICPDRSLRFIWTCVFIMGGLTVVLKIIPFFYQGNHSVYSLILPIAFALSNIPGKIHMLMNKKI